MVVRQLEGGVVIMVQLACPAPILISWRLCWTSDLLGRGEQILGVNQGFMIYVIMVKLFTVEMPSWEYVLLDIKYRDSDEE